MIRPAPQGSTGPLHGAGGGWRTSRLVISASLLATMGVLPAFLLAALAVFVRAELAFSEAQLGVTIACSFGAAAVMSGPAGHVVQRLGPHAGFMIACLVVAGGLVGAATAGSWAVLTAWLALGGVGNAFIQVAANLLLAGSVAPVRHGLAFGIKQSAIPGATLLAGAAVPLLGLTVGWRAAFLVAAAGVALGAAVHAPRGVRRSMPERGPAGSVTTPTLPLVLLTLGVASAAAAATSLGTFLVEFAVAEGWGAGAAGALLAAGSAICIVTRILVGWGADRMGAEGLRLVALQLAAGSVALVLLPATVSVSPLFVLTTLTAFAIGWGWSGLFNFAVVQHNPSAPAAATGVTQIGVYAGAGLGPMLFGFVVSRASYLSAWVAAAILMAAAAAIMVLARRPVMALSKGESRRTRAGHS